MSNMKTEKGKIVKHGMGGFLCPPGHPMHEYSVETDLRRRPENRTSMSLEYAVESPMLDAATKAAAKALLAYWEGSKRPLKSAAVRDWIHQVLGYFKGCYNFQAEENNERGWYASNLTIDSDLDPMENIDFHAGVHCIRKYYPDYVPTRINFLRAYWGQKPARKPRKTA